MAHWPALNRPNPQAEEAMELYDEAMELLQEADVNVGVELEVKYNI